MEKILTYKDVEDILFNNLIIQREFPKYKTFFDSYMLANMTPGLKNLAIRSVFGLMESFTTEEQEKLSKILGYKIKVYPFCTDNFREINCNIENIEFAMSRDYNFTDFCLTRNNQNEVKILCWR